ncbi:hypothetical protein [Streptomyces swartbergensis]|uniref:hypothetical protein n=1 Tax=Streptomyces swartbergensis TaxID=487165 RepID=UPI00382A2DA4
MASSSTRLLARTYIALAQDDDELHRRFGVVVLDPCQEDLAGEPPRGVVDEIRPARQVLVGHLETIAEHPGLEQGDGTWEFGDSGVVQVVYVSGSGHSSATSRNQRVNSTSTGPSPWIQAVASSRRQVVAHSFAGFLRSPSQPDAARTASTA